MTQTQIQNQPQNKARDDLMQIFNSGIDRVRGRSAVAAALKQHPPAGEVLHLVAIGKAASDMTLGALDVLGERITDGLLITKHQHTAAELHDHARIAVSESDHPVPTEKSLHAGQRLLDYLEQHAEKHVEQHAERHAERRTGTAAQFLFLLSGGASSLVEVLPDGMRLADLKHITQLLLAKGLDIAQMNAVRQAVSHIKGGRLATYLGNSRVLNLMISDVPGDDPSVIGSGLLNPPESILSLANYPQEIKDYLANINLVPPPDKSAFTHITTRIVARLDDAKQACLSKARALGYDAHLIPDFVGGDVEEVALQLCITLEESKHSLLIWGGEPSMNLPPNPGRGGRNQHLALLLAKHIIGQHDTCFVIAGTDGSDGPTTDAGAFVAGNTMATGAMMGLDIDDYLARADSGSYLHQIGNLITTGPTGTNVMDLMIGVKGME